MSVFFKVIKPNESVQAGAGTSEEFWCCNLEQKQERLNCEKKKKTHESRLEIRLILLQRK